MKAFIVITSIILSTLGFAGGGGSSSSYDSGSSSSSYSSSSNDSDDSSSSSSSSHSGPVSIWTILEGLGILATFFLFIFIISHVFNKTLNSLFSGPRNDPTKYTPQEQWLCNEANKIFLQYQSDWSNFNTNNLHNYCTPAYSEHAKLMLEALHDMHRQNLVENISINRTLLLRKIDANLRPPFNLSIKFYFSGLDRIIDTKTNQQLYSYNATNISETWNFTFDGNSLKLSGISQPTASAPHLVQSLANFALNNHLFYSPDWGRYCLPSRGLIFDNSSLTGSDVNNHIIGKWDNCLIQMYTYAQTPGEPDTYYLVGQLTVPKEYLGVIVKSKKFKHKPPKTYQEYHMEWSDFNKRYQVYALQSDAVPAFELLNPTFMTNLYDKKLDYNIEVVDNVIYIFAPVTTAHEAFYQELLDILIAAHKELEK